MIHPSTELRFINPNVGYGLIATEFIPRGTITWVLDDLDRHFLPEQLPALHPTLQDQLFKYSYLNRDGKLLLCWDLGRYVNHSCDPNCMAAGYDFEIALRDIAPGEQLTNDYATLNQEDTFSCRCGSPFCRGEVGPGDFNRLADDFDDRLQSAFSLLGEVPQPLWKMLSTREKREMSAVLEGHLSMASCRHNHLNHLPLRIAMSG